MDRKAARIFWRDSIKQCWDNRCAYCNGVPIDDNSLTIDHVKPRSKGGQDLASNCVPACHRCNKEKAAEPWRPWFQRQSFYCPVRQAEIEAWLTTGDRYVEDWWKIGQGSIEHCLEMIESKESSLPPAA